jgi:hypothetical protein
MAVWAYHLATVSGLEMVGVEKTHACGWVGIEP